MSWNVALAELSVKLFTVASMFRLTVYAAPALSITTSSVTPGVTSPAQFRLSDQVVPSPPASQLMLAIRYRFSSDSTHAAEMALARQCDARVREATDARRSANMSTPRSDRPAEATFCQG